MSILGDNFNILNTTQCIEILKNALKCEESQIELENYKILPVTTSEVLGLIGEYFHLIIEAKTNKNSFKSEKFEYFIKSLPITDSVHSNYVDKFEFFPKETGLYRTLFKDLNPYRTYKWHPECYYVGKTLLVMEDLHKQNYHHMNEFDLFTLNELKIVLRCLASMHANSIIFEEKTGINIGEKYAEYLDEVLVLPNFGWFRYGIVAIHAVAKTFNKFPSKDIEKLLSEKFVDALLATVKTSQKYRNVLCHRDLWTKNILFKYDEDHKSSRPTSCVFIDFQIARYHPLGLDVLQFVYLNTDRKLRDNHLNELLQFYYDCLSKELQSANIDIEQHLTWTEFLKNCEEVKILPLAFSALYSQLANLPDGYLFDLRRKDPELYITLVSKDRQDFVLDRMKECESYKERMLECVEEIIEYVMEMEL